MHVVDCVDSLGDVGSISRMSVTVDEHDRIMIEFRPKPGDKFLGRGVIDGQHVADLWLTHGGWLVALDPRTILVSRNPDLARNWERQKNGDWHPVEIGSDAPAEAVGWVKSGMER